MKHIILLNTLLLSILLSSCATTEQVADDTFVFTQETRERLDNSDIPLNQVQFYLSSTIILERTVSSDSAAVSSGKVVLEKGVFKNRIVIPENTPGIFADSSTSHKIFVSFEAGNSLPFSSIGNGDYVFSPDRSGSLYRVQYDGESYIVRFGKVEIDNSTGSGTASIGRGYRILEDEGTEESTQYYHYLEESPSEIKLELNKSEFDNFDLKTRVVDGLRVN